MTKGTEPHIALTVFKNNKPIDKYTMILQASKKSILKLAKIRLREALDNGKPLTKDMFSKIVDKNALGLTLREGEELRRKGITKDEFELYKDKIKNDLEDWIKQGQAISELFVLLLLDNEQQGE